MLFILFYATLIPLLIFSPHHWSLFIFIFGPLQIILLSDISSFIVFVVVALHRFLFLSFVDSFAFLLFTSSTPLFWVLHHFFVCLVFGLHQLLLLFRSLINSFTAVHSGVLLAGPHGGSVHKLGWFGAIREKHGGSRGTLCGPSSPHQNVAWPWLWSSSWLHLPQGTRCGLRICKIQVFCLFL